MSDAYYNAEKWGFAPRPKPAVKTVCIPGPDGYSDAGFPFDDDAQGEELDRVRMAEAISRVSSATHESPCFPPLGGHPAFYKILDEMKALYSQKHYQYATDADPMVNFRLCGDLIHKMLKPGIKPTIAAALCLMSKQIVGVYEIVGEGKTNTIESLQDKLRDIGIYSVILQILVAETQKSQIYATTTRTVVSAVA